MKYAGLIKNDLANAQGVCVSFFVQGCPHHCPGCFNKETWDFNGGKEFTQETLDSILSALTANNVHRDFCLLGGEPLCPDNLFLSLLVVSTIKEKLPDTKIYIWTGYTYEELMKMADSRIDKLLNLTYCLIDGPFIQEQKDITLQMRGSCNQHIIYAPFDQK